MRNVRFLTVCWFLLCVPFALAQQPPGKQLPTGKFIAENYTRSAHKIPMRDGVQLYTIVYSPRDKSQQYPIIMTRTPYSIPPYEEDKHRFSLGPNPQFTTEDYILVYQ